MCPGDAASVQDIDELRPRPRMSVPARGNRFRRLRNRPARLLPTTMPARHRPPAPRPQGRPFAGSGAFVINSYPAMCVRLLTVPDVTIPRPFGGTRLGYAPPDRVCGG
jgi:hypothetical protein